MSPSLELTLSPAQASRVVAQALRLRKPALLVGPPGVGKTELLMQAAAAADHDILMSYPALEDPTDPKGLPWFNQSTGEGDFMPMGTLRRVLNATRPTMWVLEDLGQATDAVQASYMSTLSARMVGSHKLPDHVTVLATTNRKQHRAGVRGLLEPVKSRFSTIVEVAPNIDEWSEWAMANGKDPMVIAFLRMQPDYLLKMAPTLEIVNSPCPRTWSHLSDWRRDGIDSDLKPAVYTGAVGAEAAAAFAAFESTADEMPSPDAVLAAPDSVVIPSNVSALYALCGAVAYYVTTLSFSNVTRFALRMNDEGHGEMAGMLIKDCLRRHPHLLETPAFVEISTSAISSLIQ